MEEMHKLIDSSPNSSDYNDQHRDPNDYVNQSAAHEVSFAFNHLKIDENESNKQQSIPESDESNDEEGENDYSSQSAAHKVSFAFNHLKIDENDSNKQQSIPESTETVNEDVENDYDDDEEEEGEFTFMCIGDNDSPTSESFEDGQIRQVFPLFDQTLLDNDGEGRRRLPIHVPVDKVFIESPRRSPSSTADGVAAATFCALPNSSDCGTPEINMKSNSTGFSKLWRFRDKMNRSNSDGRDAFVFLETSDRTTNSTTSFGKANAVDDSPAKVNDGGGKAKVVKKGIKAKKLTASAHEVYLKQRGGQTEDERRRSYLPYRPGLMGFFTNVNGGLSKNVHPF